MDLYKKDNDILKQENNILRKENNAMKDSISRFEQDREFSLASKKAHYENILVKVSTHYSDKNAELSNPLQKQMSSLSIRSEQASKKKVSLEYEKNFYVDENKRLKEQHFVSRSLKNVQLHQTNLSRTAEKDMSNFSATSLRQSYNSNPDNTVVSRKSNGTESIKGYVRVPRRISGDRIPGD